MITSLNINQKICDDTIKFINEYLQGEDDIVFLHEVTNAGIEELKNEELTCLAPYYPDTARFKTIAIVKNEKNIQNIELQPFILSQKNRTVFLLQSRTKKNEIVTDLIIGIHAPAGNKAYEDSSVIHFWESLIDMIKNIVSYKCLNFYGINRKIQDIVIVGDLNVYVPGTEKKRLFNRLLSVGMVDLWIENNKLNNHYTYKKGEEGSRIDYALISDDSWNSYNIKIVDDTRGKDGFTDHSAIIINRK